RRVKEIESRSEVLGTITPAREETPTMLEKERASRRPQIAPNPTVPAAFPVMAPRTPSEPPLHHDITVPSEAPPELASGARISIDVPKTPSNQPAKLQIPSPFAPMAVQTISVTPMAKLDPVSAPPAPAPTPRPDSQLSEEELAAISKPGSKMLVVGIVLAIVGLVAAAIAITTVLLQK